MKGTACQQPKGIEKHCIIYHSVVLCLDLSLLNNNKGRLIQFGAKIVLAKLATTLKKFANYLWINEEGQTRSALDYVSNFHAFFFGHESQNGENDSGREKGSASIDSADQHGVAITVMVEFVV